MSVGAARRQVLLVMEPLIGGTLRHLESIVERVDPKRFELTLAVSFQRDPSVRTRAEDWRARGASVVEIPMRRSPSPSVDARALRRLIRLLAPNRFDVLHTHSSKAGFLGRLAARLTGFGGRVLHTPHVFPFQQPFGPAGLRLFTGLERTATHWTDRVIVLTRYQELLALQVLGVTRAQLAMVPNGIDLEQFEPMDQRAARKALGVSPDAFVIGFAGRFSAQKGLDVLAEAVSRLAETEAGKGTLVLHAGDLPDESRPIGRRIRRLTSFGRWQCVGLMDDVRPLYGAADIVAVPSRWEGMPFVVLEAMAMARPIVATSVSGLHEVIENEADGLLVPPDHAGAMAEAIQRLRSDPSLCERLASAARRSAARWPVDAQIASLEQLYLAGTLTP